MCACVTDMARLARTLTRAASRGAGGAALGKLRLEAEARMQRPSLHRVLLAALADYPNDKVSRAESVLITSIRSIITLHLIVSPWPCGRLCVCHKPTYEYNYAFALYIIIT